MTHRMRYGRSLFARFLIVLPLTPLFGQISPEFSGYIVQMPVFQRLNGTLASASGTARNQSVDATRLRLRPTVSWGDDSFVMLEHELSAVYLFDDLGLFTAPSTNRRQVVDLSWDPATGRRWYVRHFVDRLYLRTSVSAVELTIGRQRVAWGSGRVWNPTDLFNPISPTSFSKIEKDGADAIVAKTTLGAFSDVTLVWNPQRDLPSNYGVRFRTNVEEFDLSGLAGVFDGNVAVGLDVAGNLFDAGVRFESLFSESSSGSGKSFVRWIAGVDNQFSDRLYALFEMQFNGAGTTDRFAYDVLRLFRGEILNVARLYGTVQASYLVHPLVTVSALRLQNGTDGSGFWGATVNVSVSDEVAASLGGQVFEGSTFSEYWYFPASFYARVDMYF